MPLDFTYVFVTVNELTAFLLQKPSHDVRSVF